MKQFVITANDAGQRADKFITKAVPLLPQALLYKYLRIKRIKLNGKRCEISTRLKQGDVLEMYINDEFFAPVERRYPFLSASTSLSVLYEDENILLADKKPGLLVHSDDREYGDTLIDRIQRYLYEKGEYRPEEENSFAPALVNRIDRNTGGIVIAAKNAAALRILNQKMKDRELHKFYLCLVHGTMRTQTGTLTGYLCKDEAKNKVTVYDHPVEGGKTILTRYRVVAAHDGQSLLEVELLTGRTHQIRAHFAYIGHPLVGDGKYGTNALNRGTGRSKQALYSYKLTFDFSTDAEALEYLNHQTFSVKSVDFADEFLSAGDEGSGRTRK